MGRLVTRSLREDTEEGQQIRPEGQEAVSHAIKLGKCREKRQNGRPATIPRSTLSTKRTRLKERTDRRTGQVGEKYKRDETILRVSRLVPDKSVLMALKEFRDRVH